MSPAEMSFSEGSRRESSAASKLKRRKTFGAHSCKALDIYLQTGVFQALDQRLRLT